MLVAVAIVVLVLLQHGKGADMGAAFGSGSAGSLFGSSGAANFLSRTTAVCAGIFFVTCLALTYFHAPKAGIGVMSGGVLQDTATKTEPLKADGAANTIPIPSTSNTTLPAPAAPPVPTGDSKPQEIPK